MCVCTSRVFILISSFFFFFIAELDECTVLRTGFDGKTTSGFEEGDTLTGTYIHILRIFSVCFFLPFCFSRVYILYSRFSFGVVSPLRTRFAVIFSRFFLLFAF